jgi:transposase InsO family protein
LPSAYGKKLATHREAMGEVIDWLTFYNHRRLHSTLGHQSDEVRSKLLNPWPHLDRRAPCG